ncbi:aspartyl protease family protein [Devosia enhydra]|uniref:Aspartyl protease family protein n=1 Tax=Devosia enhydra TaxID=665118 RepID=A0A1K2I0A2_9HYPH|nr:TIGR02281 family clan AA aspartic protease [Devosia enhydra]SFZ85821.1 aspartyl protease family protein [Devosia enhydra]
MLFIGVALLVAVGLAFVISSDAGSYVGLTEQQTGALIPLVILLIVFAGGAFGRRQRLGEMVGNLLAWGGIFTVVLVGYSYRDDLQGAAARVFGELMPGRAIIDQTTGNVTFRAGRDGHFLVDASVNGAPMTLLFDTGASAVVLTHADAEAAGIDVDALRYNVPVSTANGTGRAASIVLERVDVGGIARNRVRAFVAEDGALQTSLLGMSFLETLRRYSVSSNALELEG